MPYRTNADLPPPVQRHLPSEAQDIYREVFNRAFAAQSGDPRQEEVAHSHSLGCGETCLCESRRQLDRQACRAFAFLWNLTELSRLAAVLRD